MTPTINPSEGSRVHTAFVWVADGLALRHAQEVLSWRTDEGIRPSDEWLACEGYYGVLEVAKPSINDQTEELGLAPVSYWTIDATAGTASQTWLILPRTPEGVTEATAAKAAEIRLKRTRLLLSCDYTQLKDSPAAPEEWATYRQELRDVTEQAGFPWGVTWPEAP